MLHWTFFLAAIIVTYIGISLFGQISGSSPSALSAFFSAIHPLPFLIIMVANMFFGLGLHYGFGQTRFAIPIAISLGVVTSFVYSAIVLGAEVTLMKILGAAVVIFGVALLAL